MNLLSLGVMLGGEIRESEFNDDRLGRLLKDLGSGETAEDIEREMSAHCLRYYRLKTEQATVRIDTTSVAVHGDDDGSGVIAYATVKIIGPTCGSSKCEWRPWIRWACRS